MDTSKSADGCRDLTAVVWVNEEIKRVIGISRDVDMAALNAMLTARRDNGRVAGFGVVSGELRRFAGQLGRDMGSLGGLVHDLVEQVASLRKRARIQTHFERASAMSEHTHGLLAGVLARQHEAMAQASRCIADDTAALRVRIGRVRRLCETGRGLSRNAAIEAVYAGSMAPTLTQVSRQAGEAMGEVAMLLSGLDGALGGEA